LTSRVARTEAAAPGRDGDDGGRPGSVPLSGAAPVAGDRVGADRVLDGAPGSGAAVPVAGADARWGAANVAVLHPHNPALSRTNAAVLSARARCLIPVRVAVKRRSRASAVPKTGEMFMAAEDGRNINKRARLVQWALDLGSALDLCGFTSQSCGAADDVAVVGAADVEHVHGRILVVQPATAPNRQHSNAREDGPSLAAGHRGCQGLSRLKGTRSNRRG